MCILINQIIGPIDKDEGQILSYSLLLQELYISFTKLHKNRRNNVSLIVVLKWEKKAVQIYGNIVSVIIQKWQDIGNYVPFLLVIHFLNSICNNQKKLGF